MPRSPGRDFIFKRGKMVLDPSSDHTLLYSVFDIMSKLGRMNLKHIDIAGGFNLVVLSLENLFSIYDMDEISLGGYLLRRFRLYLPKFKILIQWYVEDCHFSSEYESYLAESLFLLKLFKYMKFEEAYEFIRDYPCSCKEQCLSNCDIAVRGYNP